MKIVVLAAGYATRLGPLTLHTPKPLLDVAGRPLLSRLLDRLLTVGSVSEVVVVANARHAEQFRAWSAVARSPVPLRVLDDGSDAAERRLGAVGDLAFALARTTPDPDGWLVSAGDMWIEADLAPAARALRAEGEPLLLVRRIDGRRGPSPYNEVTLEDGRVVGFREKPPDPRTEWAAIALYLFPAEIGARVDAYLTGGGNPDAPGHFVAWLVEHSVVRALPLEGAWQDIGTPEQLAAARARLAAAGPHAVRYTPGP